jgi:hypothetical protein
VSEHVDVIVELDHDEDAASVPALQASFAERAAPVEAAVADLGGEVVDRAWINSTLRVKIPADALPKLSAVPGVTALDAPRPLTED